jgi:maleamate amidohydrolase
MRCGIEGWEAIRRTKPLLAAAREYGAVVVFTLNAGRGSATSLDRSGPHLTGGVAVAVSDPGDNDAMRFAGEIHRDIPPQAGDLVLRKGSSSAFFGTPLLAHLIAAHVDTVLVCGNTTSGCVRHTVLDSASYQFKTAVIEDCTFDRTEASHAINLFDMHQKYADVISSDEAIRYLESVGPLEAAFR